MSIETNSSGLTHCPRPSQSPALQHPRQRMDQLQKRSLNHMSKQVSMLVRTSNNTQSMQSCCDLQEIFSPAMLVFGFSAFCRRSTSTLALRIGLSIHGVHTLCVYTHIHATNALAERTHVANCCIYGTAYRSGGHASLSEGRAGVGVVR